MGALASVVSTYLVTGALLYEAVNRFVHPTPINGKRECSLDPDPEWPSLNQLLYICGCPDISATEYDIIASEYMIC